MPTNAQKPSAWAGLLVAVCVTVTIFAFQYRLRETLGDVVVFSPFLLATVVAAWYGGLWSGLVATALSTFLATYFFVAPVGSLTIGSAGDAIGLFLIVLIGVATSLVSNLLHVARGQLVAEQARLRISEEFHQAIAELTSDFAFAYRIDNGGPVVEAVSAGFTRLFGFTAAEVAAAGGPETVIFGAEGRGEEASRQLQAGMPVEEEFRYVGRDGRVRWLRFHTRPVRDPASGALRLVTAGSDVTQRKQAEVATRATEERFRVMAETVPSMIWTADADGTITYANEQWMRFCGMEADEHRGWPSLVVHPDDRERCLELWARATREGTDYEVEVRHQRHDGAWRWFVTRARPLRDADGLIVCWFGVTTDIHGQKELQERLRLADRHKDEFLATLAHELRNPLAPIASALEIMELVGEDPTQQESARAVIRRQLKHLVRLVDDLLDVNRITRGKLDIRRERIAVAEFVRDAIETTRPLIDARRHDLVVSMPDEPLVVFGDAPRLAQVCANLLNNAAKFTNQGGQIVLTVMREGSQVVIRVRDSGVGIPEEVLPRVFEAFAQGDTSLEGSRGGLGIGLTLVRRLVEAHNGTINAVSDGPGRGSEFVVRLPLAPARMADVPVTLADMPVPVTPRRILVVDDNEDAATSLGVLLRLTAHDVRTARDGEEALQLAAADRPDVVLLDIGIPKINGYAVAERIREQPWGKTMALIALTGWGQPVDRERSKRAGFDHHLTKPVDHAHLARLLADMPQPPARAGGIAAPQPSAEA